MMDENEDIPRSGPLDADTPYTQEMAEEYVANTYEHVASSMWRVREAMREYNRAMGRPAYAPITFTTKVY